MASPRFDSYRQIKKDSEELSKALKTQDLSSIPLIVLTEDSEFASRNFQNFLWITFTRSNPSHDVWGVDASTTHKHWGCKGPLIIDARIKSHHAPPLIEDKKVKEKIDKIVEKALYLEKPMTQMGIELD